MPLPLGRPEPILTVIIALIVAIASGSSTSTSRRGSRTSSSTRSWTAGARRQARVLGARRAGDLRRASGPGAGRQRRGPAVERRGDAVQGRRGSGRRPSRLRFEPKEPPLDMDISEIARRRRRPGARHGHGVRRPGADGARRAAAVQRDRIRGVAVFSAPLGRRAAQRRADPAPDHRRGRARAHPRRRGRLPHRPGAHRADQAAGDRGAQGRRRRLLAAHPRRLRRRAGPARDRLQRHAAPARAARLRAQAVHRHRLARAAHADLLARRVPRAARGRGARRGDPRPVPAQMRASRSTAAQAGDRAAGPLTAGGGLARAATRADRRGQLARARSRRSSHPP